jgi:hypothetical protein
MRIDTDHGELEVVNEPMYTFDSADNVRSYPIAEKLEGDPSGFATHGVLLNGEPLAVFGDSGCTGVHENSAVYFNGKLFLAVGDKVVCFRPHPFKFEWQLQVDSAACFGIHYQRAHDALISHGEPEITRFSEDGVILWSSSGADIFSEGFSLLPEYVEAVDFNHDVYRFSYANGEQRA